MPRSCRSRCCSSSYRTNRSPTACRTICVYAKGSFSTALSNQFRSGSSRRVSARKQGLNKSGLGHKLQRQQDLLQLPEAPRADQSEGALRIYSDGIRGQNWNHRRLLLRRYPPGLSGNTSHPIAQGLNKGGKERLWLKPEGRVMGRKVRVPLKAIALLDWEENIIKLNFFYIIANKSREIASTGAVR
jgi:hypothetical protein